MVYAGAYIEKLLRGAQKKTCRRHFFFTVGGLWGAVSSPVDLAPGKFANLAHLQRLILYKFINNSLTTHKIIINFLV